MRKLHIAIVQQSPDIGGAEIYLFNLISEFIKKGSTVTILVNKGKFYKMVQALPVHIIRTTVIIDVMGNIRGFVRSIYRLPFLLFFYGRFLYVFKYKKKGDVLFSAGYSEKLLLTFLSIFFKIPIVWVEYAPLKIFFRRNFGLTKFLYKLLSKTPKKIIVPSKNTYNSLLVDAGVAREKLVIIPCGTYIPQNRKQDSNLKVSLGLDENLIIGNASRLTREKGQQYLIDAMPSVLQTIPNARLLILGQGPDRGYFESLIKARRLEGYVSLLGYQKDINQFYSIFDLFVFPTPWELEGFGLVSIEAMAHHIPLVATNFGPIPEIVEDNKNGILVTPNDTGALAEAIIKLAKDQNKRRRFGKYGYHHVKTYYDITKTSATILSVLDEARVNYA